MNKTLRAFLLFLVISFGVAPSVSSISVDIPSKPRGVVLRIAASGYAFVASVLVIASFGAIGDLAVFYVKDKCGSRVSSPSWWLAGLSSLGGACVGVLLAQHYWKLLSPQGSLNAFNDAYRYFLSVRVLCDIDLPESICWMSGSFDVRWPLVGLHAVLTDCKTALEGACSLGNVLVGGAQKYSFSGKCVFEIQEKIINMKPMLELLSKRISFIENDILYSGQLERKRKYEKAQREGADCARIKNDIHRFRPHPK